MTFDPTDPQWFPMDTEFAWWDSTHTETPPWFTTPGTAVRRLTHDTRWLRTLALTHSYRTITTDQLHRLDTGLPARPDALLYRDLATMRLVDLGWPKTVNGRWQATPNTARLMALRLPKFHDITGTLTTLGVDPFTIGRLGPRPLRGIRQYDRHNLICTELACRFHARGTRTLGEAWGRFDMLFHDPQAGRGGPDLNILRGDGLVICVEATASTTGIRDKINRWNHLLDLHPRAGIIVCWLDCAPVSQRSNIHGALTRIPNTTGRMKLADARQWLHDPQALGLFSDGTTAAGLPWDGPRRIDPHMGLRNLVTDTIRQYGLDASQWTLRPPLTGPTPYAERTSP